VLSDNVSRNINDDWRGIYTNRNSLAPVAGVAVIMAVSYAAERRDVVGWLAGAASVIAAGVMWGSGSRTSALALVLAVTVATILVGTRLAQRRYGPSASAAGLGLGLLASAVGVAVIAQAWEESTFVQRRTIWDLVWDQIGERPLHGHGWFSIWTIPEFTSQHRLLGRGSGHGSFLEVWLGVGVVGLVLFLVIVGLALVWVLRTAWRDPGVASWTWLVLVLFLVGVSLTESFVLWFSYNWVLLMAAALQSGVGLRRRPDRQTAAPSEAAIASGR
jgi:O-antigen ligase